MPWKLECEQPFGGELVVRRHRLHSGLGLIVVVDRAAPILSYQTWFRVGSRHERPGATGMAHFFEHLMFNETRNLPAGEFDRVIETVGGDTNAATWVDWTFYRASLPARELELAVRLESDRMQNLVLEDEQLEAEREVIVNERLMRVEDDVEGFLDEQLMKLSFSSHPYHWPTIGWMEDIQSLAKAQFHDFYRTWYAPNAATVVVVGDVDEQRTLELVERYYGDIPAAELPADAVAPEPPQTAERRASFPKPVSAERVLLGYRAPAATDPDWIVLELISDLLTGGPSARLYRDLIVDRELAVSVDSGVLPFRDPSLLHMAIGMTRGHGADEAIAALDRAVDQLVATPVPDDELDKIKNGAETDFWSPLATCDGKGEALGHYELTLGDFRALFGVMDRMRAVTAADIQRVAARYLRPEQRTVVVATPGGDDDDDDEAEA